MFKRKFLGIAGSDIKRVNYYWNINSERLGLRNFKMNKFINNNIDSGYKFAKIFKHDIIPFGESKEEETNGIF